MKLSLWSMFGLSMILYAALNCISPTACFAGYSAASSQGTTSSSSQGTSEGSQQGTTRGSSQGRTSSSAHGRTSSSTQARVEAERPQMQRVPVKTAPRPKVRTYKW